MSKFKFAAVAAAAVGLALGAASARPAYPPVQNCWTGVVESTWGISDSGDCNPACPAGWSCYYMSGNIFVKCVSAIGPQTCSCCMTLDTYYSNDGIDYGHVSTVFAGAGTCTCGTLRCGVQTLPYGPWCREIQVPPDQDSYKYVLSVYGVDCESKGNFSPSWTSTQYN